MIRKRYLKFIKGMRIYREVDINYLPPFEEYKLLLNNKEVKNNGKNN